MAEAIEPYEELSSDNCWGYLASQEVGRLGVSVDGLPEIFPVNFGLDGEFIVFRTAEGSKLEQLSANNNVAFEIDGWDDHEGWSVIVSGVAEIVESETDLQRFQHLPLRSWVDTVKQTWVRIVPTEVSGRYFTFVEAE